MQAPLHLLAWANMIVLLIHPLHENLACAAQMSGPFNTDAAAHGQARSSPPPGA